MGEFLFAFEPRIPQFYLPLTITVSTEICQKEVKLFMDQRVD